MKVYTLSTAILLNALALLAPLTEAAPVDPVEAKTTPRPVPASVARRYLDELTIKPKSNEDTYRAKHFPHWTKPDGGECDTRELVLIRDGLRLETDDKCAIKWGLYYSPFDGEAVVYKDGVDVASIVTNYEAWVSGASEWTTDRREAFANDMIRPQLLAATESSIKDKGDWNPVKWMPRVPGYQCLYIRSWITVKHYYSLSVDQAEHDILVKYITGCPEDSP